MEGESPMESEQPLSYFWLLIIFSSQHSISNEVFTEHSVALGKKHLVDAHGNQWCGKIHLYTIMLLVLNKINDLLDNCYFYCTLQDPDFIWPATEKGYGA